VNINVNVVSLPLREIREKIAAVTHVKYLNLEVVTHISVFLEKDEKHPHVPLLSVSTSTKCFDKERYIYVFCCLLKRKPRLFL